jgi:hypothetical protein
MQTFLPYPGFPESARVIDYRRLGKQRVEAMQILNILTGVVPDSRWKNHPAVKMWAGYENALKEYTNAMIREWIDRGYKNNMLLYSPENNIEYPWWFGNADFHRSHRSRLIQKNREFYLPLFPDDEGFNGGKYFWPDNDSGTFRVI